MQKRTPHGWLNRTLVGAGVTSALADLAYETTQVILPGFLAVLGVPAVFLGIIEGVADAVASLTKLAAGFIADRLGARKTLVVAGYAMTPLGQVLIALAGGWPLVLVGRVTSWFGKGLRGPLRDTIIAEAITPETRGRAFGFHRAMDTLGAIAGPALGVLLLGWAQDGIAGDDYPFRFVLWWTLVPGTLAAVSFAFLVKDERTIPNQVLSFGSTLRQLPPRFRAFLAAVGVFGVGDFSHSLLILGATQLLTPRLGVIQAAQVAGLLYVLRNIVQSASSYPIGALADRLGHRVVLLFGYLLGASTAALMVAAFAGELDSVWMLAAVFVVAGLYVAVQEALEPSLTAEFVPENLRSTAYGALGAVNGVGKLVASAGVGFLWTAIAPAAGFAAAMAFMVVGTVALARVPPDGR